MSVAKKETKITFNNMMLVDSVHEEKLTFMAVPLTDSCPFVEIIFDPKNKILAVINKQKKSVFHFMPRLNDTGLPVPNKDPKTKISYSIQQQRMLMETFHEHYIKDVSQIEAFLNMFVVNPEFDYKKYL